MGIGSAEMVKGDGVGAEELGELSGFTASCLAEDLPFTQLVSRADNWAYDCRIMRHDLLQDHLSPCVAVSYNRCTSWTEDTLIKR